MNNTVEITEETLRHWKTNMPDEMLDALSSRLKLLSDPTRLKIIRTLCDGDHTVQEIVNTTGAGQANISKHLALMHANGVVSRKKDGLKCYYHIADERILYACYYISISAIDNIQKQSCWIQKVDSLLSA